LAAGLLVLAGCTTSTPPPPPGDGSIKDLTPAAISSATTFRTPVDAALSPDGKVAFFIAVEGDEAAIYRTDAPSTAAPVKLFAGAPLVSPFGIDVSTDGARLVLSDPGAQVDPEVPARGELYTLDAMGGTPARIAAASGYKPRGLAVTSEGGVDVVYFSGAEASTGLPGVFKVGLGGGAVAVVAKDAPLHDPSGLAVAKDGTVYVMDASDPEGVGARLLKVSGGVVSVMQSALAVGYPAGVALSQDEKTVLVSALDPATRTDAVLRVPVAGGEVQLISSGIDAFEEPAGLHRARNVDTFIWADSKANGGGTVYVINKQQ
jgi:hypothetical protein